MNELIKCACGCNQTLLRFDSRKRERKYISGHNTRILNPRANPMSKETIICLYCGRQITAYKSNHRRFCSRHCKSAHNGQRLKHSVTYAEKMRAITLKNGNKPPKHLGKDHWNWRGGITSEERMLRNSEQYRQFRIAVWRRDGFTCQECGQIGKHLHVHHVKSFKKHPLLRYNPVNGITLCVSCHLSLHGLVAKK